MRKLLTIIVVLDDSGEDLALLDAKTNEEWAAEMRKLFDDEPAMSLKTVVVEDMP